MKLIKAGYRELKPYSRCLMTGHEIQWHLCACHVCAPAMSVRLPCLCATGLSAMNCAGQAMAASTTFPASPVSR